MELTGNSGLTVKAGTPVVNVEIGASYIRLPIENIDTKQNVLLQGAGIGFGVGFSISTPVVTVSGSLAQFPSGGIGKIIEGAVPLGRPYKTSDFFGEIMVFSMSGGKEVSGQLSGVLWLREPIQSCILRLDCSVSDLKAIARSTLLKAVGVVLPAACMIAEVNELYRRTKCVGCFLGMNFETQLIGLGADVFRYRVTA
jgi:hypothetical protein